MLLRRYDGSFEPGLSLEGFCRQTLAVLGREYLLHGHLQDRAGLPLVMQRFGEESMTEVAIAEWMGASPVYSKRTQRALNFVGDDVSTCFKNLQLDIGAPHQFMDFRFRLDGPRYGEFWLAHCGALMDVEPFGEQRVKRMCHDIEDPTFDATAAATHPAARFRPIHRPPRSPADRTPHCQWKVVIDDESQPFEPHPNLEVVRASRLATTALELPERDAEPGGWPDYSGPFDPDFQLEDLGHRALVIALQEFALQSHLLARSFLLCIAQRFGDDAAREIGTAQWEGIAGLTAERLVAALGIQAPCSDSDGDADPGDDLPAIAKLFQIHPSFLPRSYVDFRVEIAGAASLRLAIRDCAALREGDSHSWLAGLGPAAHPVLDAIAATVNPRARCLPTDPAGDALAWEVVIDPKAEPRPEPTALKLARLSRGAKFQFEQRRGLRP